MNWNKYFKAIEMANRTEINQELRNAIKEHFGSNLKFIRNKTCVNKHEKSYKNIRIENQIKNS